MCESRSFPQTPTLERTDRVDSGLALEIVITAYSVSDGRLTPEDCDVVTCAMTLAINSI